jgi:hypothetical protein
VPSPAARSVATSRSCSINIVFRDEEEVVNASGAMLRGLEQMELGSKSSRSERHQLGLDERELHRAPQDPLRAAGDARRAPA